MLWLLFSLEEFFLRRNNFSVYIFSFPSYERKQKYKLGYLARNVNELLAPWSSGYHCYTASFIEDGVSQIRDGDNLWP